jgi:hypothetical protein
MVLRRCTVVLPQSASADCAVSQAVPGTASKAAADAAPLYGASSHTKDAGEQVLPQSRVIVLFLQILYLLLTMLQAEEMDEGMEFTKSVGGIIAARPRYSLLPVHATLLPLPSRPLHLHLPLVSFPLSHRRRRERTQWSLRAPSVRSSLPPRPRPRATRPRPRLRWTSRRRWAGSSPCAPKRQRHYHIFISTMWLSFSQEGSSQLLFPPGLWNPHRRQWSSLARLALSLLSR